MARGTVRSRIMCMYAQNFMLNALRGIDGASCGVVPVFWHTDCCVFANEMVNRHENTIDFESSEIE